MSDKKIKVLFIYPALFMQTNLPLGIASLVAELSSNGIEAKIFDTVLYQEPGEVDENEERAQIHHSTKKLDYLAAGIEKKKSDLLEDFAGILKEYNPDIVALSTTECTYAKGIKLTKLAKEILKDVIVIAGGVFPTLAPEIVIKENSIDILCTGEGEEALSELCRSLQERKDYTTILNLWIKNNGNIIKNRIREPKSLDTALQPDFSLFNDYMFFKPMQGNLFKTIPVELSRSCPYQCTYCAAPSLRKLYNNNGHGSYFRKKSVRKLFKDIDVVIRKYSPEFIYFTSECFLAIDEDEFNRFIDAYGKIKIPFWIQTRPETITYERIAMLKQVGLFWLTIGIEHGNEEYRRKYLKRYITNNKIIEAIQMLERCGQGASLNNIIGFPFETRSLIYDTIMLNRQLFKLNNRLRSNIFVFTPFRGCQLYDLCVSEGLFTPLPYMSNTDLSVESLLKFSNLTNEDLKGMYRTFPLYVYLPDDQFERIKLAEEFTEEGNNEYDILSRKIKDYLC